MSNTKSVLVDQDGRTSCHGAYTSISIDDGVEYCKACYEAVTDYVTDPTVRYTFKIDQ